MSSNPGRVHAHETIVINATDGNSQKSQAREVFSGGVDESLLNWKSKASSDTTVELNPMSQSGFFPHLFGHKQAILEFRRLQWNQVVAFSSHPRARLRLGPNGSLFLLTRDGEPVEKDLANVFVVFARVHFGNIQASLHPFDLQNTWYEYRQYRLVWPV